MQRNPLRICTTSISAVLQTQKKVRENFSLFKAEIEKTTGLDLGGSEIQEPPRLSFFYTRYFSYYTFLKEFPDASLGPLRSNTYAWNVGNHFGWV